MSLPMEMENDCFLYSTTHAYIKLSMPKKSNKEIKVDVHSMQVCALVVGGPLNAH